MEKLGLGSLDAIIQILEEGLQRECSCHDLRYFAVDQEMLQELEILGCLDRENCRHPDCPKRKELQSACLSRWKMRKCGVLTPADAMLIVYTMFRNFV